MKNNTLNFSKKIIGAQTTNIGIKKYTELHENKRKFEKKFNKLSGLD